MKAIVRSMILLLGTLLCVLAVTGCGTAGPQTAGSWSFDHKDIRKVVGASTHIFVGRVVAVVGNKGIPTSGPGNEFIPRTQFSVEVLENIKGDLSGTVTVNQMGGSDVSGTVVVMKGDTLLEVGETYLLATWHSSDDGWHSIVAEGYGNVKVEDADKRSREVERYRSAIVHQILPSSPEFEQVGTVPDEFKLPNASER